MNTNKLSWNAYAYAGKQERAPLCDRSRNLPISSEHDLTYDVITWWPVRTSTWNFHSMCQIDQREGTLSFAAIRRVLRELFAKKHGEGSVRPPRSRSARVKIPSGDIYKQQIRLRNSSLHRNDLAYFWEIWHVRTLFISYSFQDMQVSHTFNFQWSY